MHYIIILFLDCKYIIISRLKKIFQENIYKFFLEL